MIFSIIYDYFLSISQVLSINWIILFAENYVFSTWHIWHVHAHTIGMGYVNRVASKKWKMPSKMFSTIYFTYNYLWIRGCFNGKFCWLFHKFTRLQFWKLWPLIPRKFINVPVLNFLVFLAHLSRRLEWAIVIAHRPSSVRRRRRRPSSVNFTHFRLLLQNR